MFQTAVFAAVQSSATIRLPFNSAAGFVLDTLVKKICSGWTFPIFVAGQN